MIVPLKKTGAFSLLPTWLKCLALLAIVMVFCSQKQTRQTMKQDEQTAALRAKAKTLSDLRDWAGTIAVYENLIKIYRKKKDWRNYADCLTNISHYYTATGDFDHSFIYADSVLWLTKKHISQRDSLVGFVMKIKGENYLAKGQNDSSLHYFNLASPILEQTEKWEDLALAHVGKSVNYYYQGNYRQMQPMLEKTFALAETRLPATSQVFGLVFQLSSVLHDATGDYDKALDWGKKMLEFNLSRPEKTMDDTVFIAAGFSNLGAFYHEKGDFDKAIEHYNHAIFWEKQGVNDPARQAVSFQNLAVCYVEMGEFPPALRYLEQSDSLLKALPYSSVKATYNAMLGSFADVYSHLDNHERSLHFADRMLELGRRDTNVMVQGFYFKAVALHAFGERAQARQFYEKSLSLSRHKYGGLHYSMGKVYRRYCLLLTEMGDYEAALAGFQKGLTCLGGAVDTSDFYQNPDIKSVLPGRFFIETLAGKADAAYRLFLASGEKKALDLSVETYRLVADEIDKLRNDNLAEGSKQFLLKDSKAIYEKAIAALLKTGEVTGDKKYQEEAFGFAQKSKAILVLERMQEAEAKVFANLPDSLLQKEASLKRDLAFYQKKIFDEKAKPASDSLKLALWESKTFDLKREIEQFTASLEQAHPAYFEMKYQPQLITVAEVQKRLLKKGEAYLDYFSGDSTVFVFKVKKSGFDVFSFPKPGGFEQQIMDFRSTLATPPSGSPSEAFQQFAKPAHALFNLLLAPALEGEEALKSLVVVPHGELSYVPFEVLLTAPAGTSNAYGNLAFLLKKYAVNYSYAAGLLLKNKADKNRNNDLRCLAFAPTYEENGQVSAATSGSNNRLRSDPAALPGAQKEVQNLSKHFPGEYFFGKEASEAAFKLRAPQFRLLHLAMHGAANADAPLFAKLTFGAAPDTSEDNILHAYEIYSLPLDADLVTLSACETGFGKFVHGEGVMSLAQSFLQAGCRSVAMSLWEAQDEATAQLMGNFYRSLADGQAKDEALRNAKLAYLSDAAAMKHPFYWGGFVLVGDDEAMSDGWWGRKWGWGLAALALVAGLVFYWVRRQIPTACP